MAGARGLHAFRPPPFNKEKEMSINAKIIEAINVELPAAVAGELKIFIEKAQADSALLAVVIAERDANELELKRLRGIEAKESDVNRRLAEVVMREGATTLKEAVLKVQQDFNDQRLGEIKQIVSSVFASNRMNYNVNLGVPIVSPGSSYPTTQPITGSITT